MRSLSKPYTAPELPERQPCRAEEKSLFKELRRTYASRYHENAALREYADISGGENVKIVAYRELPDTEIAGYPYAISQDENGDIQCHFSLTSPLAHELVVGATGCGKTKCCVEPRLRVLSSKRNKTGLFITDPKGELFANNAAHLRRQGYKIYVLNFKDVLHSDCWCPLTEIYDVWIRQKGLTAKLRQINDRRELDNYELQNDAAEYGEEFWSYGEKAFADPRQAARCYEDELASIHSETADLVHQTVHALIPDTLLSKTDPSWFMGAQEILSGILYAMLEDALDGRSGFTRDTMNLMTVQDYFDSVRSAVLGSGGTAPLLTTKKLMHKTDQSTSIKQLRTYFENAAGTTRSYLGCFRNAMQKYFNDKIFTICNGNTVDLDHTDGRPIAIFLITRDFEKTDFTIAAMFIDWVYRKLLTQADSNHGKLDREFVFMLDEFANIPPIRDFENKITISRSRNIWCHMFIQSYSQLDAVYGRAIAQTILDNCGSHVFLGSQNYETKFRFAKECGKQAVPDLESVLNPSVHRLVELPLITVDKLERLSLGQMYVRRAGMPVLLTEYRPSFLCREFAEEEAASPAAMGIRSLPFNAEKYQYAYLKTNLSMGEFARAQIFRAGRPAQPLTS